MQFYEVKGAEHSMKETSRLTPKDIQNIGTYREEAINLVKHYAIQYKSKEHYEHLGASCVMSATNTVDTIVGSAQYLNGAFLMPDEIHVNRLVAWFIENKDYECDKSILTFYFAHYIKRKINELYRTINKGEFGTTFTIMGNNGARKEFAKQYRIRKNLGVKIIRQ